MGFLATIFVVGIVGAIWLINRNNRRRNPLEPGGTSRESRSAQLTTRALVVTLIGCGMLMPLALVDGVISERQSYYHSVIREVAGSWGSPQELRGPVLLVPFVERTIETKTITDDTGRTVKTETPSYVRRVAWVLPEEIAVDTTLNPETRKRGIYESLVYTGDVKLMGHFAQPDLSQLSDSIDHIEWEKASLVVLLTDLRSLDHVAPLEWNGTTAAWESGVGISWVTPTGFHAAVTLDPDSSDGPEREEVTPAYDFSIDLAMRGSEGFYFAPLGRTTTAEIRSTWPDPSFQGPILPTEREVTEGGFVAQWEIPQLARDYPQIGHLSKELMDCGEVFVTGVRLFESVSLYSLIERSAKYGILFVALTFMTFLVFELQFGSRLHYIQYALIGAALALFFLTLLSLAEHIGFASAYGTAATLAIAIITTYTGAALRSRGAAAAICVMLAALYGLLYTILHLVDFALLMGTGLLTLILVILMVATRNLGSTADPTPDDGALLQPSPSV